MNSPRDISLSVVIPVYNDAEVLPELHRRLTAVLQETVRDYEVVLVDDGSADDSVSVLLGLQAQDDHLKVVRLTRNFGQAAAISAGFDLATKDVIAVMDSDLQDPPETLPQLLDTLLEQDKALVLVRWKSRQDGFLKVGASRLFNYVAGKITAIDYPRGIAVFRVFHRRVLDQLDRFPEVTAHPISLTHWMGHDHALVSLDRDERFAGQSSYTIPKMLKIAFDRIFSYSLTPIRAASCLGVFLGCASLVFAGVVAVRRLLYPGIPPGWASLAVMILFLFAVNFLFLGVIGEYLGRILLEAKGRPRYVVDRIHSGIPTAPAPAPAPVETGNEAAAPAEEAPAEAPDRTMA